MKNFAQKSREAYNQKADHFDQTFDARVSRSYKKLLLAEARIKPHDSILDVGCGNGTLLKMFQEQYAIRGYGVDIAEKMIENARKNCPDMTFEVNSCEHTSFPDQTFDVVTVCLALHHFPDLNAFAREVARVLKPHGLLYIAEGHLPVVLREITNLFVPFSKEGDVKIYSPREIRRAFAAYGLEMTRYKRKGIYPMLIEMQKG